MALYERHQTSKISRVSILRDSNSWVHVFIPNRVPLQPRYSSLRFNMEFLPLGDYRRKALYDGVDVRRQFGDDTTSFMTVVEHPFRLPKRPFYNIIFQVAVGVWIRMGQRNRVKVFIHKEFQ